MLAKLKEHPLVWKYVDWALSKDQKKGVEIFTQRSSDELTSERMRYEVILESLQNYKEALAYYLEYLIYTKNVKVTNRDGIIACRHFIIQTNIAFMFS